MIDTLPQSIHTNEISDRKLVYDWLSAIYWLIKGWPIMDILYLANVTYTSLMQ